MRLTVFFAFLLITDLSACRQSSGPASVRQEVTNKAGNSSLYFEEPLPNGMAIVREKTGKNQTLVNAKGDTLIPFSNVFIRNSGSGLAIAEEGSRQTVFGPEGKIFSCSNCQLYVDGLLERIYRIPKEYTENGALKNDSIIVVLDFRGKEFFRRKGLNIERLTNERFSDDPNAARPLQPYYKISRNFENGLADIVTLAGKPVHEKVGFTGFYKGIAYVARTGKTAAVDTSFREVIPFKWGYEHLRQHPDHPQQAYSAGKNGRYGLISPDNKVILPFIYSYPVEYNSKGKAYLMYHQREQGWYVLNMRGDTIITPEYSIRASNVPDAPFYKGVPVQVIKTNKMGFMGGDGRFIIPADYDFISSAENGKIIFFRDGRSGYFDENGKLLASLQNCERLSFFESGYAACGVRVHNAGRENYPSAQVTYSTHEAPSVMQYRFFKGNGKFLNDQTFDWVYPFRKGYAMVMKNSGNFLIDSAGNKVLVEGRYPIVSYFHQGFALAFDPKKKKFGLVDEKLQLIVPVAYDEIATKPDETNNYYLPVFSATGSEPNAGFTNYYADVVDGKLKVIRNGKVEVIEVRK